MYKRCVVADALYSSMNSYWMSEPSGEPIDSVKMTSFCPGAAGALSASQFVFAAPGVP